MRLFLTEFAFEKSKIEDKVRDVQFEIIFHLIKILLYPKSSPYIHWKIELKAWLDKISFMKSKNGNYLKAKNYLSIMYDEPIGNDLDVLKRIVETITEDYKGWKIRDISLKELNNQIHNIISVIANDFEKGTYRFSEIERYL